MKSVISFNPKNGEHTFLYIWCNSANIDENVQRQCSEVIIIIDLHPTRIYQTNLKTI